MTRKGRGELMRCVAEELRCLEYSDYKASFLLDGKELVAVHRRTAARRQHRRGMKRMTPS